MACATGNPNPHKARIDKCRGTREECRQVAFRHIAQVATLGGEFFSRRMVACSPIRATSNHQVEFARNRRSQVAVGIQQQVDIFSRLDVPT